MSRCRGHDLRARLIADRLGASPMDEVLQAAQDLGVRSHQVAFLSDIGLEMKAAQAAGAVRILVPSARTLRAELEGVPFVAPDLCSAVTAVLGVERSWVPEH